MAMNVKKTLKTAVSVVLGLASFCSVGCKKDVPDTEDTLEVYCMDAGYGTQWCKDLLEIFKQQDWVKEKYPNLNVVYSENDIQTFAESKLNAGRKANSIDLLFGSYLHSFAGPGGEIADLTDLVYNTKVPGEDVTYKEKANESYNQSNRYIDVTDLEGEPHYYVTSWVGGMNTILYNETMLEGYGLSVPNTTDELLSVCAALKAEGKYSFIQSKESDYFSYLFSIWWAQYEGIGNYLDFWNGIYNNRYSIKIFEQEGREKSLEIYQSLLEYDKGYLNPSSFLVEFMEGQTLFLKGEAAFHVNGDWFDNEMRATAEEVRLQNGGKLDTFKTMRLPVVSSLGTKLGISDETLSDLIDYVDGASSKPTFTSEKGYSETEVIDAVREARSIVGSIGSYHTAVIPDYATGKAVAADFLRFMATDIALEAYIKATGGASLPFEYNLKAKNPELYNSLGTLQQSRFDYFNAEGYQTYTLPAETSFPLAVYGGLSPFVSANYYGTFSAKGNTKTPHDYMTETISAWTQSKWENACSSAGIAL